MIKKIPNILSILRIILIPLVAWLILFDYFLYALITTLIIAISDFLDGFIARIFNAQSEIGSYLDSIADKAFIISAYMLIGTQKLLPIFVIIIVISRDIIIMGAFVLSFAMNQKLDINPLRISKINTFLQFTLIILVLVNNVGIFNSVYMFNYLIDFVMYVVIATTVLSLLFYIKQWLNYN
jgi:cardiolipin synthase